MSIPYVLRNYTHFQRSVDLILDEPGSTDTHLHERATASLKVFDEPGCLVFNESVRVTPDCLGESKFSSKHLIEAFYHTAQDLNLPNGSRYILASVCACALVADAAAQDVGTGSPTSGLLHSEVLARELQALAQDIWLMHLGTLQQFLDSSVSPSEPLREQLLKRDTYMCFKTGAVDVETQITDTLDAPRSYKDRPTFRKRHVPAPICQGDLFKGRTNPDQTIVDKQTLHFLERYLEITDICTVLDSPCNNLLLHPFAARQFTSYRWTLKPTPVRTCRFRPTSPWGL
ncbi:hypothetical protein OH76DRAFT_1484913 [Lentinus brumalis]|uniref:HNH nuclease domain-containing protein n=1 Tax=Lentinus brumalis TaxID=2498619 RepID=A0A371D495_9APHY|nr:hypothetical protein OH76DRAFT_1484913 [Polyporus brumalis]